MRSTVIHVFARKFVPVNCYKPRHRKRGLETISEHFKYIAYIYILAPLRDARISGVACMRTANPSFSIGISRKPDTSFIAGGDSWLWYADNDNDMGDG
ncbi:hypothetical protein Y032_0094g2780 [Ancylostoma ceylanicum]|uniref:Uncharacterized protein n=1 Tax=Ancylostoma ceylanicum TaxID=53326 RepID=A0A016TLE7_9BILA|nr:hypothetical protein Y032_0094g2780 [Ancylostoma ceylanicum]